MTQSRLPPTRIIRTLAFLGALAPFLASTQPGPVAPRANTTVAAALDRPDPRGSPDDAFPDLPPLPPAFHRGIAYAHSWQGGGYGTPSSARSLLALRRMGITWIALTPFGYQASPGDTVVRTIFDQPGHETDRAMALDIAEARRLGMRVLLKPHLWIDHGSWPGDIAFPSPGHFAAWFDSYSRMILHYADFAERAGVEVLSIGCELKGVTSGTESAWRDLIAQIRRRYHGQLTYAANWDEYEHIAWWDALDAVGINAYFPLSDAPDPSLPELMAGAAAVRKRLDAFHARTRRPILFTEIGYGSVLGAASRPWEAERAAPMHAELQRRCYEAIARTFSDVPWLQGVYWWKWFSAASGQPDAQDRDPFSPRNKPAQGIIEAWYGAEQAATLF